MDVAEYLNIHIDDDLLTRALRARICPICLVLQTKTNELLCSLQLNAVRDENVHRLVISTEGYCHFHFWYLEKLASPVTNARLLEKLLDKINRQLFEDTSGVATRSCADTVGCSVCRCCGKWEDSLLSCFAKKIREKDFSSEFQSSSGLCLPHLSEALKKIGKGEERAFLVETSRRQLNFLIEDLRRLITKSQNMNHTPGGEDDSSYRAVGKLVGGRYYRAG